MAGNEIKGRADASQILYAIQVLEAIDPAERGQRETAALENLYSQRDAANLEMGRWPAVGRGAMQGASFGFADEIGGLVGGQETQDAMRLDDFIAQQQYPKDYGAGKFAGMAATSVLPAGWVGRGASLAGMAGRGLLAGAVEGGAQGFGEAQGGFMPRMEAAAPGAAIGAVIGAGAPLLAAGAGAAVRGGRNLVGSIANRSSNPLRGMSGIATRNAMKDIAASSRTVPDIQDYLNNLGPEAMLADVPGALQGRAMGIAGQKGPGGDAIVGAIRSRGDGAATRTNATIDDVLGGRGEYSAQRAAQTDLRQNVGSPLYEAAKAFPDPINTDGIASSISARIDTAGPDTGAVLRRYKESLGGDMSAEQLHNVRSDLSDAANAAARAGNGKQANVLKDTLREIDNVLDNVPHYSEARRVWADTHEIDNALNDGLTAFRGGRATNKSPEEIRAMLNGMKEGERTAFLQGVRQDIRNLTETSRAGDAAARRVLLTDTSREKLNVILGEEEAGRLIGRLNSEQAFVDTRGRVVGNSITAQRSDAIRDSSDMRASYTGQQGPVKRAADQAGNALMDALTGGRRAAANADIGKILSAQGPQRDAILAQLLQNVAQQGGTRASRATETMLRPLLMGGGISMTGGQQ